jgi:Na+-translocating ferredoxin:NAD+ oxidoreductase RnfG subunit
LNIDQDIHQRVQGKNGKRVEKSADKKYKKRREERFF